MNKEKMESLRRAFNQPDLPLISCVMPTADRAQYVPHAVRNFLEQDYPNKELIILDDGVNSLEPVMEYYLGFFPESNIRYYRLEKKIPVLGVKRNYINSLTQGELIAHWDDDDWRAKDWLSRLYKDLSENNVVITGLNKVLYYRPADRKGWRYEFHDPKKFYVAGGTMLYTRDIWKYVYFPPAKKGSDTQFVWNKKMPVGFVSDYWQGYVASVHDSHTSPRPLDSNTNFKPWDALQIESLIKDNWMHPAVNKGLSFEQK